MTIHKNDNILPTTMRTLSEVMQKLKERGMDHEFSFSDSEKLEGFGNQYKPTDLSLIRTFRFEGMSDPADNSAIYLLKDKDNNLGYILDVYGGDSNFGTAFNEFLKEIPTSDQEEDFD